ncbi:DctP family TRAP transporter solute-binding subunit [Szabonella alba]|uniref:DctP family TRAP transporter solute-binding subunit n=1 Tax=Szabonella alba TaxID=2804194 RepID=A0A8K0Y0I5_9RHOB|nr:DctP family TRAP transporter solute-binding subunit [Szabonella alba]MBL4917881.1 DctP family TRAP transporter solute-binding subunit [Szabonella alba]
MTLTTAFRAAAMAAATSLLGLSGAAATEIKFGIGMPEGDSPEYNALVRFKDYVEFKTNGEITVRLFPNNQLGGEREMIEMVQQGSLELSLPADGAMAGFYPPMQVWSVPYLFESAPLAWKVLESDFAERMKADMLETTGIRALAFSQNGFRSFTNNVRPLVNPEDMAGLKIRTMESPVYMEMVNSLGATAVPISGAEVVMALRQGVVDGQENPPAVVYTGGHGEVQKYYTLNEHTFGLHVIIANEAWFAALDPGHQQVIRDAASLMAWTENLQKTEGDWRYSRRLAEELGMEIHVSTPAEKAAFKEITQPPVLTFIRSRVGDELVDDLIATVDAAKAELYGE